MPLLFGKKRRKMFNFGLDFNRILPYFIFCILADLDRTIRVEIKDVVKEEVAYFKSVNGN